MKRYPLLLTLTLSAWLLSACSGGMPQLFWSADSNKPAYARGESSSAHGNSRAPLDVPPELRKNIEVPMPDKIAVEAASGNVRAPGQQHNNTSVAGSAVSLDARRYTFSAAQVFSAVVDAMTALNLPVSSVDSPSGTITTEWVSQNINSTNSYFSAAMKMVGAGGPSKVRYRYVVRVLRVSDANTQLEIRTLGQQFVNHHWSSVAMKKKVANELFSGVEEQLARLKQPTVKPATTSSGEQIR